MPVRTEAHEINMPGILTILITAAIWFLVFLRAC